MKSKFLLSILCLVLLFTISIPEPAPAQSQITVRLTVPVAPETLDPALASSDTARNLVSQIFRGLVSVDEQGIPSPELATDWYSEDGGQTWVFYLREDVFWVSWEGEAVGLLTAQDVDFAFNYAYEFNPDNEILNLIDSVDPLDDFTVVYNLIEPVDEFPLLLADPILFPLPQQPIEEFGWGDWTAPDLIWTNGPYYMNIWEPGTQFQLARNPHWTGEAAGNSIDHIQIYVVPDNQEALELYQAGAVDLVEIGDVELWKRILSDDQLYLEAWEPYSFRYLVKPYLIPVFTPAGMGPFEDWFYDEDYASAFGAPEPVVEEAFVIPDTTKILDEEILDSIVDISEDGATYVFAPETERISEALGALQIGDTIVAGQAALTPNGFLRRIAGLSYSDNEIIIETEQAALDEAITFGYFEASTDLEMADVISAEVWEGVDLGKVDQSPMRDGFYLKIDAVLYDDDGNPDTTNDQIKAAGNINIDPINIYLEIDIENHKLEYLRYTNTFDEKLELEVSTTIDFVDFSHSVKIAEYQFAPITIWLPSAPPFPIVFSPKLEVIVGIDGNVSLGISSTVFQESSLITGVEYRNGSWGAIGEPSATLDASPPTITTEAGLKAHAGPKMKLMLYGVVGPTGTLKGYLKLKADPSVDPWWTLTGGVEAGVGVEIKIFSHVVAGYKETLFKFEKTLLEAKEPAPANVPTPDRTPKPTKDTESHTKAGDDCPSKGWPPKCWPWWVWIILIVLILVILFS